MGIRARLRERDKRLEALQRELELSRDSHLDLRAFIRDQMTRAQRTFDAQMVAMGEVNSSLKQLHDEIVDFRRESQREFRDSRLAMTQHRQALAHILDRLGPPRTQL